LHIKPILLRRIEQQLLISLIFGRSQGLPSSDEDFEPSNVNSLWKKNLVTKRFLFLLLAPLVVREISGTSKDNLSPEDVRPFPKPGPRCDRRQRKKVKPRIVTDYPINNRIEQEASEGQL
jgi:hypothetical protein